MHNICGGVIRQNVWQYIFGGMVRWNVTTLFVADWLDGMFAGKFDAG